MNSPSAPKPPRTKRQPDESFDDYLARRPWSLPEALLWWFTTVFSVGVIVFSLRDGWVLNQRIERIHEIGSVISAQVQDHGVMVVTQVTTDRLVVPLLGTATLAVGTPLTLQQRASGRNYLCDLHQHCYSVRIKSISASLAEWTTPQALGISDQVTQEDVPPDDIWDVLAWSCMLVLNLGMRSWSRPFGTGKQTQKSTDRSEQ